METYKKRYNITPEERAKEFSEDFKVIGNNLFCFYCNKTMNSYDQKKTLTDHIKSIKHIENKSKHCNLKPKSLDEFYDNINLNSQTINDFIEMMCYSNIPLFKREKMDEWLHKYMKN